MGQALHLGPTDTLKKQSRFSFQKNGYTYSVEAHGDQATYSVTGGGHTLSLPIVWTFGLKAQTWVLQYDGRLYESLVSYYPSVKGLAITTGDEGIVPTSIEQAMGRKLAAKDIKDCFGCHASDAVIKDQLVISSMRPGVQCEHCHAGATAHAIDAVEGVLDYKPRDLRKQSSEEISHFCGQCHRTWEFVVRNRWRGAVNVRFQPYRLANSKCYDGTDPRISCLACHDPHQDLVRQDSTYDSKCLACHATSKQPDTVAGKACPVAKENCVTCHMPKVKLPGDLMTFTDHQIRIVKPGDAYPN